jgi:hypothetical protein
MIDEKKLIEFLETRGADALGIFYAGGKGDPENTFYLGKLVAYTLIREKIRAGEFE